MSSQALDPRRVEVATVLKSGRPAAILRREPAAVEFSYLPEYLAVPGSPVATTLPLTERPVRTPGRAVPPFFANLLPEGRRLTALRRSVKTSADDDLSLLLSVGGDPVGDVQVLPVPPGAELSSTSSAPELQLVDSWAEVDFADLLATAGVGDPSALAGVQDKVSGRMLSLPLAWRERPVLLKFEVPEYPHVVENEAWFLQQARRLRHPVARAEVVHDRRERPALLVTRFDRRRDPDGNVVRLAVEDGAQLLDRYPADKYAVTAEEVGLRLSEVCAAPLVAARAWLLQLCFAWLTGNGDLHAKNVSALRDTGEWRVAPIYDIPATACYGDDTLALTVGGRDTSFSRRTALTLGARLGLPGRATESALRHVLDVTAPMIEELSKGTATGLDQSRRSVLVRTMRHRRRVLEG